MVETISLQQARRFMLRRQGLLGAHLYTGRAGVTQYVERAGCLQYDPVELCAKSPEIALHARVKGFRKPMLQDKLYRAHELYDYIDKNACVISMRDYPFMARTRARYAVADLRSEQALRQYAPVVREYLRANGPCFSDDVPVKERVDWYWAETTAARAVLESMFFRGEAVVCRRDGARRAFDLAEKHVPSALLCAPDPFADEEEYLLWQVKRRVGALGLTWARASDAMLGTLAYAAAPRARAFDALTRSGELIPVQVSGLRDTLYYLRQDAPLMEQAARGGWHARTELIPPLDTALWDRKLIEALFGFEYRWEIYTPAVKRRYGCYTMPLLQGARFVARVDFARDRRSGALHMNGYWPEPGVKADKAAMASAFDEFAAFCGAEGWEACLEWQAL